MRAKNRERIRELEAKEARGELGRDKALEQQEYSQLVRPVRAIAEQAQKETEATMAGMGESTSPARLAQLRAAKQSAITDAMTRASDMQSQRVAQRAVAEKGELEARRATEYQAGTAALGKFAKGGAMAAQQYGAVKAAQAQIGEGYTAAQLAKDIKEKFPGIKDEEAMGMAIKISGILAEKDIARSYAQLQRAGLGASYGMAGRKMEQMVKGYLQQPKTTSPY